MTALPSIVGTIQGTWAAGLSPAVNTQATASRAAAPSLRHVCTAISCRLLGGTTAPAATTATLNLRDGATGAGTVLQTWTLAIAAAVAAKDEVVLTNIYIVGSPNTAMTIEFSAASGANTFQAVNMVGFDI